jgi:hypothetical protein
MSDDTAQAAGDGMSEQRLAEIRMTVLRGEQHLVVLGDCDTECAACAVAELLAEVERLRKIDEGAVQTSIYAASMRKERDVAFRDLHWARHDADQLRARLAEIGETEVEWRAQQPSGAWNMSHVMPTEDTARRIVELTREMGYAVKLERRVVGEWCEVPDA